ncbi:hypothetical protein ABZV14_04985 [Streptosporangium canum]|uniref:hypothetical protein n=1 Tax=Streptosporangium canum TaxID=324952 RepID=UPI0033A70D75
MSDTSYIAFVKRSLAEAGIATEKVEERLFPGELWLIAFVARESLLLAQSMAGSIEEGLNSLSLDGDFSITVTFRAPPEPPTSSSSTTRRGKLASQQVDQLIQLLEARSRTSDALPSLRYIEDPRAGLAAVKTSRHHIIYGRRGVGKTALMLEAKRHAEGQGYVTAWLNAQIFRRTSPSAAFLVVAETVIDALLRHGGTSQSDAFAQLRQVNQTITQARETRLYTNIDVDNILANLNKALRPILREDLVRLYVYIDDFYFFPIAEQPLLLDYISAMLRDCNGWLKIASIERLTRPFEPSSKLGIEIPHDASKIDLDLTLEEPSSTQAFLESILVDYTTAAGITKLSHIAGKAALGRLALASGGVLRDYITLFASSIVVAREKRLDPQEVGKEDVSGAARKSADSKKRDLEQDASENSGLLLSTLERLSAQVQGERHTFFRVDFNQKSHPGYEVLAQLVDLRFAHLIQANLSDQHKGGVKYEVYMLALSEFSDVRLKRGLYILDLENGEWSLRLTGKAKSIRKLRGTQFRDALRQAPLVDVDDLVNG